MPLETARDSTIAVVGDGFGSLMVYSTAVYLGFGREEITIYGDSPTSVGTYGQFAFNLGQTVLRSESESHFRPADWPTLAQLEAWSRWSAEPLWRSIRRKYNPGVPDILAEATVVQQRLGWDSNRYPKRIGWIDRKYSPVPHFVLYDEEANFAGRAKHVVLAMGHSPLAFPPALAKARDDPAVGDRIAQAYESKTYASGGRYVVVGAGIAAVNEWTNILDTGGSVISLLRSPEPDEQDLNAPRCLFEARGIDAFQGLSFDARLRFLGKILKGTSPKRKNWAKKISQGRAEGRFDGLMGEIDQVQPGPAGLRIHIVSPQGGDLGWLDVTGVVAATGFNKSTLTLPLLRRLVDTHDLPLEGARLKLRSNCGVPKLDLAESRLCMMGIHANTVIPHGDTIAGLKYIARRFVADCARAEQLRRRGFMSRLRLQLSLTGDVARVIRHAREEEQLA